MHEGIAAARALVRGVTELLLPPACAICRVPHRHGVDGIVCPACLLRVVALGHPQCARCGHPRLSSLAPLPTDLAGAPPALPPCRWCERLLPIVRSARSVCRMDVGSGGSLVHALKYGAWPAVAIPMARRMARLAFPDDVVAERAALIPMPLSPTRLRERGYNQAERLATALAGHWRMPVWDALQRVRHTKSQVQLTPSERSRNVLRAFAVRRERVSLLRGQHIVLVDDVITTSATLNAAAQALVEGGARIVSFVTFGRAPDPGDRADSTLDSDRN